MRVKTVWFKRQGERPIEDLASVIASNLWRLADKLVDNLSKVEYDIVTPARGFKIIAEVTAYGLHLCDRRAYSALPPEKRAALIQAIGARLADTMEQNVRELVGQDGRDYRAEYIAMLNRRAEDYASFDIPDTGASFPALRFLGLQIREGMEEHDQHWVMDHVMDIEMPELLGTLKKTLDGLFSPDAAKMKPAPRRIGGD
jgi:hypothetical protein